MNQYPAIDLLQSISRIMKDVVSQQHLSTVERALEIMSTYKRYEDVITIGAYKEGSNPRVDFAIRMMDRLRAFIRQPIDERVSFDESLKQLMAILGVAS
jgi:flagellum-specific ATP synthase